MLDTINLKFLLDDCSVPHLDDVKEKQGKCGPYIIGKIKNLIVKVMEDYVYVFGSLQKFVSNDLERNLTFQEDQEGLRLICDLFAINPSIVKVTRLDIAKNIEVEHEPSCYQEILGYGNQYFRYKYKNSLYYGNTLRKLCIYNKTNELLKNGYKVTKRNLLRYEARFMKARKCLGFDVMVADLLVKEVYDDLVERWKNEYKKIVKVLEVIDLADVTPKDIERYLAAAGLRQIGVEKIMDCINYARKRKEIGKDAARRHREKIKSFLNAKSIWRRKPLVEELDRKILA